MDDAKDERFQDEVFEPYALAIGQAVLAWNDLHKWLGVLLESILFPRGSGDSSHLYSFWEAMTQDRAARDLLKAAASHKFSLRVHGPGSDGAASMEKIKWLLGQVDRLEQLRNDIVHTTLIRDASNIVQVSCEDGASRAARLRSRPDLLAEIHWCRDVALALRDYVLDLDRALESVHGTLPDIPSLPNRGQKKSPPNPPRQPQSG